MEQLGEEEQTKARGVQRVENPGIGCGLGPRGQAGRGRCDPRGPLLLPRLGFRSFPPVALLAGNPLGWPRLYPLMGSQVEGRSDDDDDKNNNNGEYQ